MALKSKKLKNDRKTNIKQSQKEMIVPKKFTYIKKKFKMSDIH